MKTLQQVEPRVDVMTLLGDANSEIVITNSGSYYLSANLMVDKDNGIKIAADGVTLDLNGFEISRASGSGGYGIYILVGADRATVRNGTIVGLFNRGIDDLSKGGLYEKLAVSGCAVYGIRAGKSSRIIDCRAHDNLGTGIYAAGGSSLDGCSAYNNQGSYGIHAFSGSILSGCSAYNNRGNGSVSYGIYAQNGSTVIECVATSNGNTNSASTFSQGAGIYVSSGTVKDCRADFNQGDGILVSSDCLVEGNTCSLNGFDGNGAGIHVTSSGNRIDGNTVTGNDRGFDVDSTGNLIIRNSASANTTSNYDYVLPQTIGPFITSGIITNTNPWANFLF